MTATAPPERFTPVLITFNRPGPLRATLEDFFLQKIESDPEGKAARGGSAS